MKNLGFSRCLAWHPLSLLGFHNTKTNGSQDAGFSNHSFPIALTYINWETDAIVAIELIRNVAIALGKKSSVFVVAVDITFSEVDQLVFSVYFRHNPDDFRQLAWFNFCYDVSSETLLYLNLS